MRYRGFFSDQALHKNYQCYPGTILNAEGTATEDYPYGVALTMSFTIHIFDDFNYDQMDSFKVYFKAGTGSTPTLRARIYTASSFNYNGKYQTNCRMRHFRSDVYYGPISWKTGSWVSANIYETPDLKEIIKPLVDRGTQPWRKYFFIIFEWLTQPGKNVNLVLMDNPPPYYIFMYRDGTPGRYGYYLPV